MIMLRYFREVNRSRSWFVIGGFRSICRCFCFWMTVTIMIDGSVNRNRKFGLKFQSSHVTVEPRFNEVAGDRPNLFVKWRVRYIEVLFHTFYCNFGLNIDIISFVISRTSLNRGSLNRGSTVLKSAIIKN